MPWFFKFFSKPDDGKERNTTEPEEFNTPLTKTNEGISSTGKKMSVAEFNTVASTFTGAAESATTTTTTPFQMEENERGDCDFKNSEKSVSERSFCVDSEEEDALVTSKEVENSSASSYPSGAESVAETVKWEDDSGKIEKSVGKNFSSGISDFGTPSTEIQLTLDDSGTPSTEDCIILKGKQLDYVLPGEIAKILYPHQRMGLRWLWSLHCNGTGGLLGDETGLGKTLQICSFLAGLFHSGLIKRVLLVAPGTLHSHWKKELSAVGLSKKIREYTGAGKERQYALQYIFQETGILLTTYDIVRCNSESLRGDYFFLDEESEDIIIWDYTILDEGHLLKNPNTQRAKKLLQIPSGHRIIISATPLQNDPKELWALFSYCCPNVLGDKTEYKERYGRAILRGNNKNATNREKHIGSTVAKELRERIEPYFLHRMKSEVCLEDGKMKISKLPKKNELIVWLALTQCQRQLYEAFLNGELVLSSFDGSALAALTFLKKICNHPYLLIESAAEDVLEGLETLKNQEDLGKLEKMALHLTNATDSENLQTLIDDVSCKITFILVLLDNLIPEGHSVLIFSQTRKMLSFLQEAITAKGYTFLRIDGTTKISDREKIVNDFQEGVGAPIFLLTTKVGGLGLTLTHADRIIIVDPDWNPSTDNQSVDRAYRIGQTKDVLVYRLITCGTIEERIYRKQVYKGGLLKTATEPKEQTRYFNERDPCELLRLPEEGFDVSLTQQQLDEEHDQHHTMDDSLKKHIEFLRLLGIAGVSYHSLLFSKTEPAPVFYENDLVP